MHTQELVTASGQIFPRMEYNNQPVVSLKMIAAEYPSKKAWAPTNLFTRAKSTFIEGKDYFLLTAKGEHSSPFACIKGGYHIFAFSRTGYEKLCVLLKSQPTSAFGEYFGVSSTMNHIPEPAVPDLPTSAIKEPKALTKVNRNANLPDLAMGVLTTLKYNELRIRAVLKDDEIWFVGKDIAIALGYSNPSEAVRLYCLNRVIEDIPTDTGQHEVAIIPERDLFYPDSRRKPLPLSAA